MKKKLNFCGIFATAFVATVMLTIVSCSQDDEYYDSDMYTLAEAPTTRSISPVEGGSGFNNPLPFQEELEPGEEDTLVTLISAQMDVVLHLSWKGGTTDEITAKVTVKDTIPRSSYLHVYDSLGIYRGAIRRYKYVAKPIQKYAHYNDGAFESNEIHIYYQEAKETSYGESDGTYGKEKVAPIFLRYVIPDKYKRWLKNQ